MNHYGELTSIMESLQVLWGNLKLNEEKDLAISLESGATLEVQCKGERSLVGKTVAIW